MHSRCCPARLVTRAIAAAAALAGTCSPACADCPNIIHFSTQPGTYQPGGFIQVNFVLECAGGGQVCGPCVVDIFIGSGCGAHVGYFDIDPFDPGTLIDIHATMIMPANAPAGTYRLCLRTLCAGCAPSCTGCQGCTCTTELITIDSPIMGDINGDGAINVDDLLAVINAWGPCAAPCPPRCAADVNDDCTVNVDDLLAVINNWS